MAGVPAGRLSIEIVAEIARLQQDLDRAKRAVNAASGDIVRSARHANDNLRSIGAGAGANVVQFSREVARLKAQMDPAWASLQRYREQVQLLRQALAQGAITHKQFVDEMRTAVNTYRGAGDAVVQTTNAQRAGMQQLSYQISDISTMFAMGARPMQIFASQSGQVIQAISMMQGGASKFSTFMMGPWGMALTAGVLVLAPLVGKLFEAEDAAQKSERAQRSLMEVLSDSAASYEEVRKALADYNREQEKSREVTLLALGAQSAKIASDLQEAIAIREKTKALLAQFDAMSRNPTILLDENMGPALANARSRYAAQIAQEEANIASLSRAAMNSAVQVAQAIAEIESDTTARIKFQYEVRRKAAMDTITDYDTLRSRLTELNQEERAALDAAREAEKVRRPRKAGLSEEAKLLRDRNKETTNFIQALQDEIAKIGLDEKALRQLEIQKAKETATTAAQVAEIERLNQLREEQLAIEEQLARIKKLTDENLSIRGEIAELERQAEVIGLVGWARERELRALESRAEILPLLTRLEEARLRQDEVEIAKIQEQIDLLRKKLDLEIGLGDRSESDRRAEEALARQNGQLREMVDLLDRIGGFGSVLGSLVAIATGDYRGIARGPVGDLLSYALGQQIGWQDEIDANGNKTGRQIAKLLGDELRDVFGPNGLFGQSLAQTLGNAGLGYAAASAVLGRQSGASGVGSAIGGIAGSIAGEAFKQGATKLATAAFGKTLGSALGSAVPVVGTILGGLAGSLIGGLFGGAKKGVVSIGGSGSDLTVGRTKHSNSNLIGHATQAAEGLIGTINNIADALGGTINAANARLTIGMRNDKWVLDPTGQARTKGSGVQSFASQEEAVKAAVKTLIDRGVIGGLRASTMNILRSGRDLEQSLQQALAFENVFKQLEASANPFKTSLQQLHAEFAQLTDVFRQAGATAAEYAQLQDLLALKQKQLIDSASASYRSTFLSESENASFAKTVIRNALEPFGKASVDTVAEYKALVKKTDPLENPELYGVLMDLVDEFAAIQAAAEAAKQAAQAQAAQKAAEAEAERQRIEADIKTAEDVLRQAWQSQRSELEETVSRFAALRDSMRDFREELRLGSDDTQSYAQMLARVRQTGQMASMGDESALSSFPGMGRDFLRLSRSSAASEVQYRRDLAMIMRYAESAETAAGGMVTEAERQILLLDQQVSELIELNDRVLTVGEAIERLIALTGGNSGNPAQAEAAAAEKRQERTEEKLSAMERLLEQQARTNERMLRFFQGISPDGRSLLFTTEDA